MHSEPSAASSLQLSFCLSRQTLVADGTGPKSHVLVTGATGFIGTHAVDSLLRMGPSGYASPQGPLPRASPC